MKNTGYWKAYAPTWLPTPALVADVELSRPIAPITLGPNYRAARLLVRVHDQPIGYVDIVARPDEVIDRTRILAALDRTTANRALADLLPLSKPAARNNAMTTQ